MFQFPGSRWAVLISLGGVLAAHAQQSSAPSAAASAAVVPVPSAQAGDLSYRSALEAYQSFSDEKLGSWRDANDNVGRIGGWREYAREAQGGTAGSPIGEGTGGAKPVAPTQSRSASPPQGSPAPARSASRPSAARPAARAVSAPAAAGARAAQPGSRPAASPGDPATRAPDTPPAAGQDPHAGHGKR
jgi:hypothetical protein